MTSTDEQLIDQALAGDLSSFDELMRRYERLVFKVAHGFGGSRENALDITQAVFLKAFRRLGSFRRESQLKTWLLRITYREGIDWKRRESSRLDAAPLDDTILATPVTAADQKADLLEREKKEQLLASFRCLNDKQRLAVTLRYFESSPIKEIAAVLQASEGVTRNLLFRSLRKLRDHLAETPYFQTEDKRWPTADATEQRSRI